MTNLSTEHWHYLHTKPLAQGIIKSRPEDFVVIEELGYEPSSEGEHIYLWVEKIGLNTAFVAEQIAKFCQQPLRAVSYAGRKDKHAVTRQWFGIHVPGKKQFAWEDMVLDGFKVIKAIRHNKKLRIGALEGNRFELVVRQLTDAQDVEQRLQKISSTGVPNYFGSQRFGDTRYHPNGGNLDLAERMIGGEAIKNRNKRSMAVSALRSWLFNEYIDQRLIGGYWDSPLSGDVCVLTGSNSFFVMQQKDSTIQNRLAQNDISLSAPMWGDGELDSQADAYQFEQNIAKQHNKVCTTLASLGLKQERRMIRLIPQNLQWQLSSDTLNIQFSLPSGCFATSVLREVLNAYST